MNILKVEKLSKQIGNKEILKDVSFEINEGDILAFIGPNGAGKTTTIKCILGLQKITSGKILINGYDIKKNYTKAISKVGCLVESPDVYMYLSGYDNLKLQASYYKDCTDDDLIRVINLVGLESRIDDKVSKYSLGMRERLGIAIALVHNPNLLILDEPTNGLDPEGIKALRELLLKLSKKGVAILISSHNLSELESFCNRVCILSKGHIIEETSIEEIRKIDENKYIVKVDNIEASISLIKDKCTKIDDNYFEIISSEEEIAVLISKLVKKKIKVYEVKKEMLSLEEAFINRAGGGTIE